MKHVVIRCDGTAEGGLGHLVRAISVAAAAQAVGWRATIAGTVPSPFGRQLVAEAGLDVVPATADLGAVAATHEAGVVHVDDYGVGPKALKQVRAVGAALSSMEDGAFGRRPADLVIDSALGAEEPGSPSVTRPDDGSGLVLRGIAYAPMRPAVLGAREARLLRAPAPPGRALDTLVVMGGSDATGAAAVVASVCGAVAGIGRLTVVAPSGHWGRVREAAGPDVELVVPGSEFLDRAAQADLVLSTASTTTWELACIGVPTVLVVAVENQRHVYDAALARGIARGVGTLDDLRTEPTAAVGRLRRYVAELRAGGSWAERGMALVDGHGAARIVDAWDRLILGRHLPGR